MSASVTTIPQMQLIVKSQGGLNLGTYDQREHLSSLLHYLAFHRMLHTLLSSGILLRVKVLHPQQFGVGTGDLPSEGVVMNSVRAPHRKATFIYDLPERHTVHPSL